MTLDIIELVQIDPQSLRRHYESLSDDELTALDRTELTEVARKCYDAEYAKRALNLPPTPARFAEPEDVDTQGEAEDSQAAFSAEENLNWLDEAACACSFSTTPGQPSATGADNDADHARAVLQAAGIPCRIEINEIDPPREEPQRYQEYRVLVPGALNLQAASVLDKEIFNADLEAEWKTRFAALPDQELRALNPDVICAGLRDRIARLTRAYNDEIGRRNPRPGSAGSS